MDTKDIRGFMRSYELRSINRAASDLFITPQGLGKAITRLEEELDAKLFTRTHNGLEPTQEGTYFFERCADLTKRIRDMEQGLKSIQGQQKSLHIGYSCGVVNVLDITRLEQFCQDHPDVKVTWDEDGNDEIKRKLTDGIFDVAFVIGSVASPDIYQHNLMSRRYSAIVCPDHPLYDREVMSVEDLKDQRLITLNEKYQSYYNIVQRCSDFGFVPDIRVKTMESILIYKLASEGLGVGIDVDIHDRSMLRMPVKIIEISDSIPWTVNMICPVERKDDELIKELVKMVHR